MKRLRAFAFHCIILIAMVGICWTTITVGFAAAVQDASEAAGLRRRLSELREQARFTEAIPIAQELLSRSETAFGRDHTNLISDLNELASLYQDVGRYSDAESLLKRSLETAEKSYGTNHTETAACLNNLGVFYLETRDTARAQPLLERALETRTRLTGLDSLETAQSLHNLASVHRDRGGFAKASELLEAALTIKRKASSPGDTETLKTIHHLASVYRSEGRFGKASELYEQALQGWKEAVDSEHPAVATTLNDLGLLAYDMGHYSNAVSLHEQARAIREKRLGTNHVETAIALNNLAMDYKILGQFDRAESLYLRALAIEESAFGPQSLRVTSTLNNLGTFYLAIGSYKKAEQHLTRALRIREELLPSRHLALGGSWHNLGLLYLTMGEFAKAESLLKHGLERSEEILGAEHPDLAASLNALASLYDEMSDFTRAVPLHLRDLAISEKSFGPNHPHTATSLNNLAVVYHKLGEHEKAEPLYQRSLAIRERSFGREHPDTANSLNNLAMLYASMDNQAKAETLCQEALALREKVFGEKHPDVANSLENLADIYIPMGKYAQAKPPLLRALAIYENIFGVDHPSAGDCLRRLAFLEINAGNDAAALDFAKRVQRAEEKLFANLLSFTSERQRLLLQENTDPYSLLATLRGVNPLARAILRTKGVVLDSLLEDRLITTASKDPTLDGSLDKLRMIQRGLIGLYTGNAAEISRSDREAEEQRLVEQLDEWQGKLARQMEGLGRARRAFQITVEQVQAALPKDAALIEFIHYDNYLGNNHWEPSCGAVVIAPVGEPAWVALGAAKRLEPNIRIYQHLMRSEVGEAAMAKHLQLLYRQLWDPISRRLPQTAKRIIISPDGELNFVSFATLLSAENRFLAEQYSIMYVASGRDLLLKRPRTDSPTTLAIWGNPDFQVPQHSGSLELMALTDPSKKPELRSAMFGPLPGTEIECKLLREQAADLGIKKVEVHLWKDATEAALNHAQSPDVLHFATHGFFLPESGVRTKGDGSTHVNRNHDTAGQNISGRSSPLPLPRVGPKVPASPATIPAVFRSGLALAGAQSTRDAWARGESTLSENDGIVSTAEISGLNLRNTWLVVLSACDTGLGEARVGEGVIGLRRGFLQAGAQNLLMTLWPAEDEQTVGFITDFYTAALRALDAPQALAEVQRDWLIKLRQDKGLAEACRVAGPFILSFQGRPAQEDQ